MRSGGLRRMVKLMPSETEHLHMVGQPVELDFDQYPCQCVSRHMPKPEATHQHHVIPLYLGGNEDGEIVPLCPNAHDNVHRKMREFDREGRITPRGYMNEFQYELAVRGWEGAQALGLA